jgi:hypothetical protein
VARESKSDRARRTAALDFLLGAQQFNDEDDGQNVYWLLVRAKLVDGARGVVPTTVDVAQAMTRDTNNTIRWMHTAVVELDRDRDGRSATFLVPFIKVDERGLPLPTTVTAYQGRRVQLAFERLSTEVLP